MPSTATASWAGWPDVAGKRESRRLLGDYVLKQDDIDKNVFHEDASFTATWDIDLHFPDSLNSVRFPGREFKAATKHIHIYPHAVPYRCLYSRNVDNLFMAGRNISVTHVALGTVRVMRTTGMMGEVVGMAASLCRKYDASPRLIYQKHLGELRRLMREGVGRKEGLPDNQKFNTGGSLKAPAHCATTENDNEKTTDTAACAAPRMGTRRSAGEREIYDPPHRGLVRLAAERLVRNRMPATGRPGAQPAIGGESIADTANRMAEGTLWNAGSWTRWMRWSSCRSTTATSRPRAA